MRPPHDETDPLLNRAPRRSAPTEARSWISRISQHVSTWSTLYLCGLLVFLVDYPNFMGDAAKVRMLELGLCRDHYRVHDPSLIGDDGSVPEELCKLKGVQSSLARMRGYLQMLQYLIGIILAVPFGVLADKWGRKLICSIGIVGVILHDTWYFVSLYFYKAFPTNAVYGAPAFILLGGGSVVVPAMIMAMLTHASTDEIRTVAFFYFSVTIMVSELIGPAVGSILTAAIGPHLAFLATIPSYFLSLVVMYFIKDEEPQATDACGLEQGEGNGLLDADYASSSTARSSRDYQSSSRGASPSRKHSMMEAVRFLRDDVWGLLLRASVLTGLLSLMVHRVYRPLLEVTIQYVSVRFGWKLRTANILLSTQAGVQIPVLLFIMPLLYRFLLRRKGSTFSANLAQASYCLVLLILGTLGMALAPVVPLFITSFIVYTLGNAYSAILRSLLASLVPQENFGLLYTTMALFDGVTSLLAPIVFGLSFSWGIEKGGYAVALPYFIAFGLYCLASVGIFNIRESKEEETEDGE